MKHRHRLFGWYFCLIFLLNIAPLMAQVREYSGYAVDGMSYLTIKVENDKIIDVHQVDRSAGPDEKVYISPGFIDTQINGYASISFNEEGLTKAKVKQFAEALWKEGVTTFFPTVITNSPELINENFRVLSSSLTDPMLAHSIPGFFLEGPYISPLDGFRGAHAREWVRDPDWQEFMDFYKAADGKIIQVGLAPELDEAMEFITNCRKKGIMVALAHHNGTADQINKAVSLGASVSTHLGNGCANYIHRHENPLWPQLANDRITATIIADGHHLRPEELKVFYKVKGPDKLVLVSDATKLAGMPPGEYTWNGKTVVMTSSGMLQYPEQNVLAGASFSIRSGVANMVSLTGCSLADAVRMATRTPAQLYNLSGKGRLEPGMKADLIRFVFNNDQIEIKTTVVGGEEVYNKN